MARSNKKPTKGKQSTTTKKPVEAPVEQQVEIPKDSNMTDSTVDAPVEAEVAPVVEAVSTVLGSTDVMNGLEILLPEDQKSSTECKTKIIEVPYHFKANTATQEGYKKLEKAILAGYMTKADIEVIPANGETPVKYKRKSIRMKLEVPIIEVAGLGDKETDHIQSLVNKAIEQAQKKAVDFEDNASTSHWLKVLQTPFAQKASSIKVTAAMVEYTVAQLADTLLVLGKKPNAITMICNLAKQKFTPTAITNFAKDKARPIAEVALTQVEEFRTAALEEDAQDFLKHEPVLDLFTANLNKFLEPVAEPDLDDLFDM